MGQKRLGALEAVVVRIDPDRLGAGQGNPVLNIGGAQRQVLDHPVRVAERAIGRPGERGAKPYVRCAAISRPAPNQLRTGLGDH